MCAKQKRRDRKAICIVTVLLIAAAAVLAVSGVYFGAEKWRRASHPLKYSEYVGKYSSQYHLEENMVYAFIKTESGFEPMSESYMGARGLMQIMPETFEWIRYRLGEENDAEMTFDKMYEPEQNIRYGCYLLSYLSEEFGGGLTEISAAYHAGPGSVGAWLEDPEYGTGDRLIEIPNPDTAHYAEKIQKAYNVYCSLYTE